MNKVNFFLNIALTLIQKKAQTPVIRFSGLPQPLTSYGEIHANSMKSMDVSLYCSLLVCCGSWRSD